MNETQTPVTSTDASPYIDAIVGAINSAMENIAPELVLDCLADGFSFLAIECARQRGGDQCLGEIVMSAEGARGITIHAAE